MKWVEDDEIYLIQNINRLSIKGIAENLGRSYKSVYSKAYSMKLIETKQQYKKWTKEEEEYLEEKWGIVSIPGIAKKLGRTIGSIQVKANELNLGPWLESGDYITFSYLVREMFGSQGAYSYAAESWINKGLKIIKKKRGDKSFRVVRLKDFWNWAEENKSLISFKKLEKGVLGEEPDWLEEKRANDIEIGKMRNRKWTDEEKGLLKSMLKLNRYNAEDIAGRLNKTEGSIKRMIQTLGLKERPIRREARLWKGDEVSDLVKYYKQDIDIHLIAKKLGRGETQTLGKLEDLIKDNKLEPRTKFRKTI